MVTTARMSDCFPTIRDGKTGADDECTIEDVRRTDAGKHRVVRQRGCRPDADTDPRPDPLQQDAAHRLRSRCAALLLHRARQPGHRRAAGLLGRPLPRRRRPVQGTAQDPRPEGGLCRGQLGEPLRHHRRQQGRPALRILDRDPVAPRQGRFLHPDLHRRRELRHRPQRPARRKAACRQEGRRAARHHDRAGAAPRADRHADQCRAGPGEDQPGGHRPARKGTGRGLFRRPRDAHLPAAQGEGGSEPADGRHLSQHRADRARPASRRQRFPPRGRHGAEPHLSARRDRPGLQRGFRSADHAKPSPERACSRSRACRISQGRPSAAYASFRSRSVDRRRRPPPGPVDPQHRGARQALRGAGLRALLGLRASQPSDHRRHGARDRDRGHRRHHRSHPHRQRRHHAAALRAVQSGRGVPRARRAGARPHRHGAGPRARAPTAAPPLPSIRPPTSGPSTFPPTCAI